MEKKSGKANRSVNALSAISSFRRCNSRREGRVLG